VKVLTVALNFPDQYHPTMTTWSKRQVDSIKTYTDIDLEVVVPRPFSIPIKFLPYHEFAKLPLKDNSNNGYTIHHPRFPYLIPKKLLFSATGNLYSFFVSRYILNNIKRPDIIHARFGYLDGYGILKACKKWNAGLVLDIHGNKDFGEWFSSFPIRKKTEKNLTLCKENAMCS